VLFAVGMVVLQRLDVEPAVMSKWLLAVESDKQQCSV